MYNFDVNCLEIRHMYAGFQNIPTKETPIVMLSEITEVEMRTLIDFMYCGEATIDQSQLEGLLKVCSSYPHRSRLSNMLVYFSMSRYLIILNACSYKRLFDGCSFP